MKAIIFDCWGTLFYDDISPHPFHKFAEKIGESMSDYSYLKVFEKELMLDRCDNIENSVRSLLKKLDKNPREGIIEELVRILREDSISYVKPYPETIETLKSLKSSYKLGLLSNSFSHSFEAIKDDYNLSEIFDTFVLSYKEGVIKPDPQIFKIALKKLKVDKNEVVMVGDSLKDDVKAAEDFGIKGILIDRKKRNTNFSRRIESLRELEKML